MPQRNSHILVASRIEYPERFRVAQPQDVPVLPNPPPPSCSETARRMLNENWTPGTPTTEPEAFQPLWGIAGLVLTIGGALSGLVCLLAQLCRKSSVAGNRNLPRSRNVSKPYIEITIPGTAIEIHDLISSGLGGSQICGVANDSTTEIRLRQMAAKAQKIRHDSESALSAAREQNTSIQKEHKEAVGKYQQELLEAGQTIDRLTKQRLDLQEEVDFAKMSASLVEQTQKTTQAWASRGKANPEGLLRLRKRLDVALSDKQQLAESLDETKGKLKIVQRDLEQSDKTNKILTEAHSAQKGFESSHNEERQKRFKASEELRQAKEDLTKAKRALLESSGVVAKNANRLVETEGQLAQHQVEALELKHAVRMLKSQLQSTSKSADEDLSKALAARDEELHNLKAQYAQEQREQDKSLMDEREASASWATELWTTQGDLLAAQKEKDEIQEEFARYRRLVKGKGRATDEPTPEGFSAGETMESGTAPDSVPDDEPLPPAYHPAPKSAQDNEALPSEPCPTISAVQSSAPTISQELTTQEQSSAPRSSSFLGGTSRESAFEPQVPAPATQINDSLRAIYRPVRKPKSRVKHPQDQVMS